MAFTITDAATWATASGIAQATVTSNAFNAASGDLIVVCAVGDDPSGAVAGTPFLATLTDSGTPDQTWTSITDSGADGDGFMRAWWANASQALSGITVTATRTGSNWNAGNIMAIKVYTVTGHNAASPIGNVWNTSNTSTANNWTPNTYTSSANNSRGFAVGVEWNALAGTPTSTDNESGGVDTNSIGYVSMYKAADTATSGTVVTFNFDAFGTAAAQWRAIAFEIKPAAGAATNARPLPRRSARFFRRSF